MKLGVVSNCWKTQLDAGERLIDLVQRAEQQGYRAIELRQTCLGDFETSEHLPIADRFSDFPERFPSISFDLAICVPFLNPDMSISDQMFTASLLAAQTLAGSSRPHLRMVDLMTVGEPISSISSEAAGEAIARLARPMIELGGILSVENSRQPWNWFHEAFRTARNQLGSDADSLRLCFDPCNLLLPGDDIDPVQATASLANDELSMIHFKQRREHRSCTTVCDGAIDWPAVIRVINEKEFLCPRLLEIDPSDEIWRNLEESRAYLRECGLF